MPTIQLFLNADGSSSGLSFDDVTPDLIERTPLIWIDLDRSERDGLDQCATLFGLHSLAVESALLDKERAQISVYDDMLFLEFYGLRASDGPTHLDLDEIGISLETRSSSLSEVTTSPRSITSTTAGTAAGIASCSIRRRRSCYTRSSMSSSTRISPSSMRLESTSRISKTG